MRTRRRALILSHRYLGIGLGGLATSTLGLLMGLGRIGRGTKRLVARRADRA